MALACISVANQLGLSVPNDVSVAGFDASPLSVCVTPTLTSVEQPLPVMAEYAVDALANLLKHADETDEAQLDRTPVVVAHKLILGGSTSSPKTA